MLKKTAVIFGIFFLLVLCPFYIIYADVNVDASANIGVDAVLDLTISGELTR